MPDPSAASIALLAIAVPAIGGGVAWAFHFGREIGEIKQQGTHNHDCIEDLKDVQRADARVLFDKMDAMRAEVSRHLTAQDRDRSPAQ